MSGANSPVVSVVMATYNHAKFVAQAIESVLSQHDVDFEFIVADDGSSDATREVVAACKDPRIVFFPYEFNRGACSVTNELISRASGKYIALINSDDAWLPGKLKRQLDFLESHPSVSAHFGRAEFMDRDGRRIDPTELAFGDVFEQENRSRGRWLRRFFWMGNCLCHPTIMVRREVYAALGPFDNRLRQLPDLDMWIRMVRSHDIHVGDEPLIRFRILPGENASSQTAPNATRTINEHYLIALGFFDGVSAETLVDGFGDLLVHPDLPTPVHLEIEKMLLYFHENPWLWRPYKTIGLAKAHALLCDDTARSVMRSDYGIGDHWFHSKMASVESFREPAAGPPGVRQSMRDLARGMRRVIATSFHPRNSRHA